MVQVKNADYIDDESQRLPSVPHKPAICGSNASVMKFSPSGNAIATGASTGKLCIWDFATKGLIRTFYNDDAPISVLDWEETGNFIASGNSRGNICIWRVLDEVLVGSISCLEEQSKELDGKNIDVGHISAEKGSADAAISNIEFCSTWQLLISFESKRPPMFINVISFEDARNPSSFVLQKQKILFSIPMQHPSIAIVPRKRSRTPLQFFILGDASGNLSFMKIEKDNNETLESVSVVQICNVTMKNGVTIKNITTANNGQEEQQGSSSSSKYLLAVNCSDRIIRIVELLQSNSNNSSLTVIHKMRDIVNRTAWTNAAFSNGNAEYVAAASASNASCQIYFWQVKSGSFVKILETKKDGLLCIDWHPFKPIVAILTARSRIIFPYQADIPEKWAAFLPDFQELDANIEYEEPEDLFDINDDGSKTVDLLLMDLQKHKETTDPIDIYEGSKKDVFVDCFAYKTQQNPLRLKVLDRIPLLPLKPLSESDLNYISYGENDNELWK